MTQLPLGAIIRCLSIPRLPANIVAPHRIDFVSSSGPSFLPTPAPPHHSFFDLEDYLVSIHTGFQKCVFMLLPGRFTHASTAVHLFSQMGQKAESAAAQVPHFSFRAVMVGGVDAITKRKEGRKKRSQQNITHTSRNLNKAVRPKDEN